MSNLSDDAKEQYADHMIGMNEVVDPLVFINVIGRPMLIPADDHHIYASI